MRDQAEYTDKDRIYGEWCSKRDQINAIDYGQAEEVFQGQRVDLLIERDELAKQFKLLTGTLPA